VDTLKSIAPERLVYVDETGIDKCLYREYARASRGQKVIAKVSGRKFKRINIVAGICQGKWVAPFQYSCATDSVLFEFWFEHCLLKEVKEDSVIILDNATLKLQHSGLAAEAVVIAGMDLLVPMIQDAVVLIPQEIHCQRLGPAFGPTLISRFPL